jgi:hypothetical protein
VYRNHDLGPVTVLADVQTVVRDRDVESFAARFGEEEGGRFYEDFVLRWTIETRRNKIQLAYFNLKGNSVCFRANSLSKQALCISINECWYGAFYLMRLP